MVHVYVEKMYSCANQSDFAIVLDYEMKQTKNTYEVVFVRNIAVYLQHIVISVLNEEYEKK